MLLIFMKDRTLLHCKRIQLKFIAIFFGFDIWRCFAYDSYRIITMEIKQLETDETNTTINVFCRNPHPTIQPVTVEL